jgi:hypothetical protein
LAHGIVIDVCLTVIMMMIIIIAIIINTVNNNNSINGLQEINFGLFRLQELKLYFHPFA